MSESLYKQLEAKLCRIVHAHYQSTAIKSGGAKGSISSHPIDIQCKKNSLNVRNLLEDQKHCTFKDAEYIIIFDLNPPFKTEWDTSPIKGMGSYYILARGDEELQAIIDTYIKKYVEDM